MDAHAFALAHRPEWDRLRELSKRRTLSGPEADEFIRLYQRTATHLATIRTKSPDPTLVLGVSQVLSSARARITVSNMMTRHTVARFFRVTLPLSFYRVRWWTVGVMVAFLLISITTGIYTATNPQVLAQLGSEQQLQHYADEAFAAYYSEYPSADFAGQVWSNNARIALQSIAGGITGVVPAIVLYQNAAAIGSSAAIMYEHGGLDVFFKLILPHGMLELTAIFIAAGAGLSLFWALVSPGPRSRMQALAEEGRITVIVACGLVLVLAVAGIIEGFVTPSSLHWITKILIGAVALALYWVYTLWGGRWALMKGYIADLEEDEAGYVLSVTA
ncbi:stage II sporulation protein M [Flaviflexus massiliensis]|uniref:stage II sporulation protein M n=1 Tax=Flaviflexus massiliensis TaxID=1522309 RepID=UPI0006D568C4|nr:stage II sporulation protein M [Flaviflexus massiliensis]